MVVGVASAAGWSRVGEYLQGLSGFPLWFGIVHVAVTVCVTMPKSMVTETLVLVMSFVEVVVTAGGATVTIVLAVPLGAVIVEKGPVVMTSVEVVVIVWVIVGVVVKLTVTVGVAVLVT